MFGFSTIPTEDFINLARSLSGTWSMRHFYYLNKGFKFLLVEMFMLKMSLPTSPNQNPIIAMYLLTTPLEPWKVSEKLSTTKKNIVQFNCQKVVILNIKEPNKTVKVSSDITLRRDNNLINIPKMLK